MLHICVNGWCQHLFWQWLAAYSVAIHYLNKCWFIVNKNFSITLHWNFKQSTKLYVHLHTFEIIVCEMAAILSRKDELKRNKSWRNKLTWSNRNTTHVISQRMYVIESALHRNKKSTLKIFLQNTVRKRHWQSTCSVNPTDGQSNSK